MKIPKQDAELTEEEFHDKVKGTGAAINELFPGCRYVLVIHRAPDRTTYASNLPTRKQIVMLLLNLSRQISERMKGTSSIH